MSSHDSTLEFDYESTARAELVAASVAREIGEIDDDRSRTTLERDGDRVCIEIDADDVIALRAALNTWFSLIDVAERTADAGLGVLESDQ
ncbi:KEOPS complex subunit Pcc1 [Natrinema hispanicum]|uniref:KEOPS complex subunit Pcc1 n=1 Tax=Natrinema hispanicum TaxID=392421 RepID=A0A1G6JIC3_9EURY|nr:KEOPS complex subunit Pcc1 [Natrinema hispanicum]SDC17676.1 KEOPS complex subunit Pcc1 [Natrinema hispanicum]SES66406.1 KEOPS complex subunit Pcc1 [Natrinema hispanicum]